MNPDEFSPDWRALWSNWLWFSSLLLSMTVALIAILAKQWINQYRWRVRAHVASNRAWAWRHRAFHRGLEAFHFTTIISTLPLMIHMSLFTFFAGLAIYLSPLHRPLSLVIAVVVAIVFLTYMGLCVIVPIVRGDCPMSTPIVDHMQHFGYRIVRNVVWICRYVSSALFWTSSRRPTLAKARDLETFLEDRLLGGSHGPKLSADALSWMLQHFRDYEDITAALEAIGSLNVYRHHGTFSGENLDRVRNMIVWRDQALAKRPVGEVSSLERAYIMRAALFVQIVDSRESDEVDPNAGGHTLLHLKVVDRLQSDNADGASPIRLALSGSRQSLIDSLAHGAVGDDTLRVLTSMDKPGLALWSAQATELLLPTYGGRAAPEPDISLRHLAILLRSVVHASVPDEHGNHVRASPTQPLEKITLMSETSYDVVLARRITKRAASLLSYQRQNHAHIFRDAEDDAWILEAIPIWFEAAKMPQDANTLSALQQLGNTLLAQLASREAPVNDEQIPGLLRAITYFTTQSFASSEWSSDALLGALELLVGIHQHPDARGRQVDILTPTCSLLEYIVGHPQLVLDASVSRVADIVRLLGKRKISRWPARAGVGDTHPPVPTGRLSLLYCPPISVAEDEASVTRAQSVWASACRVLSTDYDRLLRLYASALVGDLRPGQSSVSTEEAINVLAELLKSDRVVRFLPHPQGREFARVVVKISLTEWGAAADRLRGMFREEDRSRQQEIERFIEEITNSSAELSAINAFLYLLRINRNPAVRRWVAAGDAVRTLPRNTIAPTETV